MRGQAQLEPTCPAPVARLTETQLLLLRRRRRPAAAAAVRHAEAHWPIPTRCRDYERKEQHSERKLPSLPSIAARCGRTCTCVIAARSRYEAQLHKTTRAGNARGKTGKSPVHRKLHSVQCRFFGSLQSHFLVFVPASA